MRFSPGFSMNNDFRAISSYVMWPVILGKQFLIFFRRALQQTFWICAYIV